MTVEEEMNDTALKKRVRTPRLGPSVIIIIGLVPAALIACLLGTILIVAFTKPILNGDATFDHFASLIGSDAVWTAVRNTAVFGLISTVIATVIGVPCAWLVERTDLRGKNIVSIVMVLGVLLPGFIVAMGWLLMFHPRIGMINQFIMDITGAGFAPFDIVNVPGMALVQGLSLAPLAFAMTSASFRNMDSSLEEAARTSGASFLQQMRRVTLPLAWPGILAATLYVLIVAVGTFDIPAVIGLTDRIFTFSTYLYFEVNPTSGLPRYGIAAGFSTVMIVIGLVLSWVYGRVLRKGSSYRVITGKNYKPRLVVLGRWQGVAWAFIGLYFFLSKGIPLLLLVWTSLTPTIQLPSLEALGRISIDNFQEIRWDLVGRAASNTAVLVLVVPTIALVLSTALSWLVVRSKLRFRTAFDYIAFVPHAVPHLVFGVGALLFALHVLGAAVPLYGTIWLLVIVLALVQISFASRMTNNGMLQIHPELEEAAEVSGANTFRTIRKIVLPLLRGTFVQAWVWLAILAFRELTLPAILFSPNNVTLSFVVWNFWQGSLKGVAAATVVLLLLALTPLAILYFRLTRHSPERI